MNGVLILDKPQEFTSFDAVAVLRRVFRTRKIGHTGTLDPMATGVLPSLVGNATRAASLLPDSDKAYDASFRLGLRTDTQDIWGTVQAESPFDALPADVERACAPLRGEILQIPPMMSAVRQNGVRQYDLARQGIEVDRPARPVTVHELTVLAFDPPSGTGQLRVRCSKGTYIRTLIADLGEALGCGAVMTALRRTAACGFTLADAVPLADARAMDPETAAAHLRPVETLFGSLPVLRVTDNQARRFANGGALAADRLPLRKSVPDGARFRLHDPAGRFVGLGIFRADAQEVAVLRLFGADSD